MLQNRFFNFQKKKFLVSPEQKVVKKKKLSRKKKYKLLKQFNHPVFIRFQHNNLFFSTFNTLLQNDFHYTVGLLEDYKKKKKKKKNLYGRF